MVRILHTADFHLDSPFAGLDASHAAMRRQESRETVSRLVDYANDHGVEVLLLAGDLFDGGNLYGQTAEELCSALRRFRGETVIAPGNHDPYHGTSPYARILWPENVHIFTKNTIEKIPFPQYGCTVYGAAFPSAEVCEGGLLAGLAPDPGTVNIGIVHGDVGVRDSRYRPITPEEIACSGLDYLALGHIHACSGLQIAGQTVWAYPGCPEGRGFDETGEKGFYTGTVERGKVHLQFVPFACRRYQRLSVDVTACEPMAAVEAALPPHTEEDIYRITLTGETEDAISPSALTEALLPRFYAVELRDQTTLRRDIWARQGEDSLRGLFLRELRQRYDAAADDAQRRRIELAARFGLAAMDRRDM